MNIFKFIKKQQKKLFFLLCLFIFLLFFYLLKSNKLSTFDSTIYQYIIYYKNDAITNIFLFFSYLCSTFYLLFIIFLCFFIFKNKKVSFYITLNAILCYGLNLFFKNLIKRPRPIGISLVIESGYSFPSGHAMLGLSFYGFFMYLLIQSNWKKIYKIITCIFLSCFILLIGISRIYLGVHYASDIVAGFSLSIMYFLLFSIFVNKKIKNTKV